MISAFFGRVPEQNSADSRCDSCLFALRFVLIRVAIHAYSHCGSCLFALRFVLIRVAVRAYSHSDSCLFALRFCVFRDISITPTGGFLMLSRFDITMNRVRDYHILRCDSASMRKYLQIFGDVIEPSGVKT
jgi:hypothetical protein